MHGRRYNSLVPSSFMNTNIRSQLSRPGIGSLLLTAILFAFLLLVFRPGYWIIDDIKIILNAIGYPAGGQVPFLIHTNVLLGFLMMPLYGLHTDLNWEVLFFIVVNAGSTWALLYIALQAASRAYRFFAAAAILGCGLYLLLNITYTITAAWACMAGIALLLATAKREAPGGRSAAAAGIGLLLIGSMIRIQSLLPVLGFAAPGVLLIIIQSTAKRRLVLVLAAAALAVGAGYAVDRLYVRAFPDWNYYYHYNSTRELLHDAHRLQNAGFEIHRVGWSANDQELFAHWFFPDARLYSLEHIRYLVDHIPGASKDPSGVATAFAENLLTLPPLTLLGLMLSALIWGICNRVSIWSELVAMAIWSLAILENLVLAWAFKDPDYLLLSTLGGSAVLGLLMIGFSRPAHRDGQDHTRQPGSVSSVTLWAPFGVLGIVLAMLLYGAATTSAINTEKQSAYRSVMADIERLQAQGKIAQNAVIISPAHGLPIDWANPLVLEPPPFVYYDTGWVTFSPPYDTFLKEFGIGSVPDAFYQKPDIYLMTQSNFTAFLERYYEEHEGRSVKFLPIYAMPNTYGIPDHDEIYLYKVTPAE